MGGCGSSTKQGIRDWIPVDSDKPNGDMKSTLDLPPGRDSKDNPSDQLSSGFPAGSSRDASHERTGNNISGHGFKELLG